MKIYPQQRSQRLAYCEAKMPYPSPPCVRNNSVKMTAQNAEGAASLSPTNMEGSAAGNMSLV